MLILFATLSYVTVGYLCNLGIRLHRGYCDGGDFDSNLPWRYWSENRRAFDVFAEFDCKSFWLSVLWPLIPLVILLYFLNISLENASELGESMGRKKRKQYEEQILGMRKKEEENRRILEELEEEMGKWNLQ